MSRWIDANKLKAFIKDQFFRCDMPEEWGKGVMWATSQINYYCNKAEAPSIDLVRCAECRYYRDYDGCFFSTAEVEPDGYCYWGERKENE